MRQVVQVSSMKGREDSILQLDNRGRSVEGGWEPLAAGSSITQHQPVKMHKCVNCRRFPTLVLITTTTSLASLPDMHFIQS